MKCEECGDILTQKEEEVASTIDYNWCRWCAFRKAMEAVPRKQGLLHRIASRIRKLARKAFKAFAVGGSQ